MHLPEAHILYPRHGGIALDFEEDVVDGGDVIVGHEQHEAEGADEAEAEDAHGEGDGGGEGAVEPEVDGDAEEGEEEEEQRAGDRQEVGGVAEDGGEGLDVGEAHGFPDAGVVAEPEGGDEGGDDGEEGGGVDLAGGDAGVVVRVVRFVVADAFEDVLQVVGDEVEAHEEEEHRHGEAGEDFGALEPERVPHAASLPDFEVAEDVDDDAEHCAEGVEEDEVREGGEGEGAFG